MPGGKFQDTVELIIAARDQATATVDKVRKKVREANKDGDAFGGQLVKNALRATSAFGTLELGLGGVNAASKAFSGNWEDAADAVERLPAGIGPFARQLRETLGLVTGISAEIERIERATAAAQTGNDLRRSIHDGARAELDAANQRLQAEQARLEIARLRQDLRQEAQQQQKDAADIAAAQRALDEATARPLLNDKEREQRNAITAERRRLTAEIEAARKLEASHDSFMGPGAGAFLETRAETQQRLNNLLAERAGLVKQDEMIQRLAAERQRQAVDSAREFLGVTRERIQAEERGREREAISERNRERFRARVREFRDELARRIQDQQAAELRQEQRLLAAEERRRANREAMNAAIERSIQARIEQVEAEQAGARGAVIGRGGQEIAGRFQTGARDQLSQLRDDPILSAAREAERTRQRMLSVLQDALRAVQDFARDAGRPGNSILPANLRVGRGF